MKFSPAPATASKPLSGTVVITILAVAATVLAAVRTYGTERSALVWQIPIDLAVYLAGGNRVLHEVPVYDGNLILHLPFTYPPFAAWLFSIPAYIHNLSNDDVLIALWQGGIVLTLIAVTLLVFRERRVALTPATILLAVALSAATLGLDPFHGTWFYGQVNILLMLLVALDVLPRRPLPGVGVGLAAGIKLTPAFFGLIFLIQRRWWAAVGSIVTFGLTVLIGAITVTDSRDFWFDAILNSSRIGEHSNTGAQSLRSVIFRITGQDGGAWWILSVALVFALTVLAVYLAIRNGNRTVALGLSGVAACLISPFSWYHHWVWIYPVALAVLISANRWLEQRVRPWLSGLGAALISALTLITFTDDRVYPWVSHLAVMRAAATNADTAPYPDFYVGPWMPLAQVYFIGGGLAMIIGYIIISLLRGRPTAAANAASAAPSQPASPHS